VDFGLAKRVGPAEDAETASLTTANLIQGTPLYVSPEAVRNEPTLDARSDLYAVGAVGFFLLTGRPVFQASTVVEVFSHHLHTPPDPPSRHAPRPVPPALDALILQCLAKEPSQRPADALTLQAQLSRCTCDPPWSTQDAAAWWAARRARHGDQPRRRTLPPDRVPTVTVDLSDRRRRDLAGR